MGRERNPPLRGKWGDHRRPGPGPGTWGERSTHSHGVSRGCTQSRGGRQAPMHSPGQRFLRQAAREGYPGGAAGPVLLLRLRTGGAGPRQSAFGSPAARRVSTAQLRPAQPGCSWRGARCQGQLQEGTQGRPGYSYSSVHNASRDGALQCPPSPLTLPPLETRKVLRTDGAERCRGQTGPALTSDAVPSPFPSRCPRLAHRLQ